MSGQWFSIEFTLTKRHLGLILIAGGVLAAAGMIAAEVFDAESGGFGALQKMGVAVGAAVVLVGLTLLPLGSRPA